MKRLKRLSTKLGFGKEYQYSMEPYVNWNAPLAEDSDEEGRWPSYNPADFEKFEQRYVCIHVGGLCDLENPH